MTNLLLVGSGDIAWRLLPLLRDHCCIYALLRDPKKSSDWRAGGVAPLVADLDDRKSLARISGLADVVIHLAPPLAGGSHDTRTAHLLAALSQGKLPRRFIYISTSGVYGDCGGDEVSETHRLAPHTARAQLRVSAEQQVRNWASRNGVRASILRVPGIYAAERLPLERLRSGAAAIVTAEDSYTNHIHADDLARIIVAALRRGKSNRVYHAVDDDEMKMGDYFDLVADAYGLPRPPRLTRDAVRRAVSAGMWSFMAESRRLSNVRMKRELKVKLFYPTVADALKK
ncbi:MAG: SDR family oxidoreductase [Gammaproteobacteria bacterium]|nr:SDR family oxidoreductase [Gammaproteobacteria bacterium]MBU1624855.1 SDR family oxidoreductase [Gammaproteobacteria bacterium]MBU1982699.1 SDR family oxidoreductase [Gammaproteobacteria bacterium]